MKIAKFILVLLALLILVACEKENDRKETPKLFEDHRDIMDKAKNVDNMLQQQSDEQNRTLDQQSQ